jgi:dolichol-phosphate mannosyltransferase
MALRHYLKSGSPGLEDFLMSEIPELSIVIPALGEAENLKLLLPELHKELKEIGIAFEILVVDNGAPDETENVCRQFGATLHTQEEKGYGGALRTGFRNGRGKLILTLDADLSHPPKFIGQMTQAAAHSDLVIASRYVAGGSAEMPATRWLLSRILNFTFGWIFAVPVLDLSSGYRIYRKELVEQINPVATNFDILQEILLRAVAIGLKVQEVPFQYSARHSGRSNAKLIAFGWSYLKTLVMMYSLKKKFLFSPYLMLYPLCDTYPNTPDTR